MQEGHALEYVSLVEGDDTLRGVFLDLKPELWNLDGTLLTLWLDPGRIKRHLQPNQKFGAPLQKGKSYKLVVSKAWKGRNGKPLENNFEKHFVTTLRDSLSPDLEKWKLDLPTPGSRQPLRVDFHEALDYWLLQETIEIRDQHGNLFAGNFKMEGDYSFFTFEPDAPWKRETYTLECESRLEDLAGNNLNRPFDRDITLQPGQDTVAVHVRKFMPR
jgi:hypothetical protein